MAYLAMLQHTFPDSLSLVLAYMRDRTVVQAGYSVPPIAETQRYVDCVLGPGHVPTVQAIPDLPSPARPPRPA